MTEKLNRMSATPRINTPSAQLLRRALAEFEVPLTRYAVSILSDLERARDAVQDTFIKLYAQEPTAVEAKLKSWLFTVCRNRCLDILKKEKRMISIDDEQINALPGHGDDPARALRKSEDRAQMAADLRELVEKIEELPPRQRDVMRLKFQGDLSYREIGEALGITTSNVGFIIHSAIKRLRLIMSTTAEKACQAESA
jgi:RNA polymerase sigma factor (sigma-70 family)